MRSQVRARDSTRIDQSRATARVRVAFARARVRVGVRVRVRVRVKVRVRVRVRVTARATYFNKLTQIALTHNIQQMIGCSVTR